VSLVPHGASNDPGQRCHDTGHLREECDLRRNIHCPEGGNIAALPPLELALNDSELEPLTRRLRRFRPRETISWVAALFTCPAFQANYVRLEILLHLAVAHCQGSERPTLKNLDNWLNRDLGATRASYMEDPPEDVFVSNILTPWGNARILEGIWERNDFQVQQLINLMRHPSWRESFRPLRPQFHALLALSEAVMERLRLARWVKEESTPRARLNIGPQLALRERAKALFFSRDELKAMRISDDALAPFTFPQDKRQNLIAETIGHTSLERHPLIHLGDAVLLASPTSVSIALRRLVLEWCQKVNLLNNLEHGLRIYQGHEAFNEGPLDLRRSENVPIPAIKPRGLRIDDIVVSFDGNKYLHVVLLPDDLAELASHGFNSVGETFGGAPGGLGAYLNETANRLRQISGNQGGMTILIFGGLGRARAVRNLEFPDGWIVANFGLADYLDLAADDSRQLLRFYKLKLLHESAGRQGVKYRHDSQLNLLAFWKAQDYRLVPRQFKYPNPGGLIHIDNGFLANFRSHLRRAMDVHALRLPKGIARVRRYRTDTLFSNDRERPLYADLDRLQYMNLFSVAVERRVTYWIQARPSGDEDVRDMVYRTWDAAVTWADRLLEFLEEHFDTEEVGPVIVELDFSKVDTLRIHGDPDFDRGRPAYRIVPEESRTVVELNTAFMRLLATPSNVGERYLMCSISMGIEELLLRLGARRLVMVDHEEVVTRVLGSNEARMVHLYETTRPVDYFDALNEEEVRFVADEDLREAMLGLAWRALASAPIDEQEVLNKISAHQCLTAMALVLWGDIRGGLRQLDRKSVLRRSFANKQAIISDRNNWRRTSQAQVAMHGREEVLKVSHQRESDRALASLSCRVLAEMALSTAPLEGGMTLGNIEFDRLLAQVALLVEVGHDCDAVHAGLVPGHGGIALYPNGEYAIDRSFTQEVVNPFLTSFFESGFNEAIASYAELFERAERLPLTRVEDKYSAEFLVAFAAEYGLSVGQFIDAMAELLDVAHDMESAVVITDRDILCHRIQTSRGLCDEEIKAFLRAFALVPRQKWENAPRGYTQQDVEPWRYRRRLSLVARPLMLVDGWDGNLIAYSVGLITSSTSHIIERLEAGWVHAEHFRSAEMKEYIGRTSERKGLQFAEAVSAVLQGKGLQCRTQVLLTELGASAALGDIDVLAWRANGPVFIVECKRLKPVKTIGEIANLFEKFLGEEEELLHKHLRRVEWLRSNTGGLARIAGRIVSSDDIQQRLVTNAHVPLKFAAQMPVPTTTILSIDELLDETI